MLGTMLGQVRDEALKTAPVPMIRWDGPCGSTQSASAMQERGRGAPTSQEIKKGFVGCTWATVVSSDSGQHIRSKDKHAQKCGQTEAQGTGSPCVDKEKA